MDYVTRRRDAATQRGEPLLRLNIGLDALRPKVDVVIDEDLKAHDVGPSLSANPASDRVLEGNVVNHISVHLTVFTTPAARNKAVSVLEKSNNKQAARAIRFLAGQRFPIGAFALTEVLAEKYFAPSDVEVDTIEGWCQAFGMGGAVTSQTYAQLLGRLYVQPLSLESQIGRKKSVVETSAALAWDMTRKTADAFAGHMSTSRVMSAWSQADAANRGIEAMLAFDAIRHHEEAALGSRSVARLTPTRIRAKSVVVKMPAGTSMKQGVVHVLAPNGTEAGKARLSLGYDDFEGLVGTLSPMKSNKNALRVATAVVGTGRDLHVVSDMFVLGPRLQSAKRWTSYGSWRGPYGDGADNGAGRDVPVDVVLAGAVED